ncbi:MAG: hypothetical protein ABL921_35160, partial [Pirellula sp.]
PTVHHANSASHCDPDLLRRESASASGSITGEYIAKTSFTTSKPEGFTQAVAWQLMVLTCRDMTIRSPPCGRGSISIDAWERT